MKIWAIILFIMFLPATGLSVNQSFINPEENAYTSDYQDEGIISNKTKEIKKYASDEQPGPQKNFGIQAIHDNQIFAFFNGDRIEYQTGEGKDLILWDVQAWVGEDYNKIWFKSEGTWLIDDEKFDEIETELLYSRNFSTFWDIQAGIRQDFKPDPDRTFAAFGIQGLAPYWFEVEATAYISEDGDISATLEAEYDLLLTQRLILQPRFETAVAVQEVEKYGVGQGINDIEIGLRLRYEIRREFAPYIGISWGRKLGETADLAEDDGEDIEVVSFVIGIKAWF